MCEVVEPNRDQPDSPYWSICLLKSRLPTAELTSRST